MAVFVIVASPSKSGEPRAQVKVNKPGSAELLAGFSQAVQDLLKGKPVGSSIECVAEALIANLIPKPDARVRVPGPIGGRPGGIGQVAQVPSPFDTNPYNFAEWEGNMPWLPADGANQRATHDRWHEGRLSGVIDVTFQAQTAVFIPAGVAKANERQERTFWTCRDADGNETYGLPGSSLKGAIRSHFEIWTNSRLSLVSEKNYTGPIPYRRRSSIGYVVESNDASGLVVRRCQEVKFLRRTPAGVWEQHERGQGRPWTRWQPDAPVREDCSTLDPTDTVGYQPLKDARLNLLWTPSHRHGYTHFLVRVGTATANMSADEVKRWVESLGHVSYSDHPARVTAIAGAGLGTDYYRSIGSEPVQNRLQEIKNLRRGELLFGIEDQAGRLACFGRNVHFIWPAHRSPGELAGTFMPLNPEENDIALGKADTTEATFGFAGKQKSDDVSHPFRSRVRFTTFWQTNQTEPVSLSLKSLTSPTGVKLKSRATYLEREASGQASAATYGSTPKFMGRKLYWHQPTAGEMAPPHHLDERSPAQRAGDQQVPPPLQALPKGSEFAGHVHFDNLTKEELGALLASIHPGLIFENGEYGIKVGKGKPRGLGSVACTKLAVGVRGPAHDTYASLAAGVLIPTDRAEYVNAFRTFLCEKAKGDWNQLRFVRDLKKLLAIGAPDSRTVNYHATPGEYGWMPKFHNAPFDPTAAKGDPSGAPGQGNQKPIGMRRARYL